MEVAHICVKILTELTNVIVRQITCFNLMDEPVYLVKIHYFT